MNKKDDPVKATLTFV